MSELKVNKITPRSGTTVTLGDSGDSVNIASGATITDFTSTGIDDNATSTAITIDSSERVGIGTSSPTSPLHIKSASNPKFHVITASPTAGYNAAFLVSANNSASPGSRTVTLALDADGGDGSGSDNFIIKKTGGSPGNVELTQEGSANIVFKTANTERMRIDTAGCLLIGRTDNPSGVSNSLYATGIYSVTGAVSANVAVNSEGLLYRATSSLRYKNTIQNATHGLTELLNLRSVTFKSNNEGDKIFGGLIAEEVHEAGLTEFVEYDDEGNPDALHYSNMVSICIKAIQEQQTKIQELEARITALETTN